MPFDPSRLLTLVSGGNFTLWHYRTSDSRSVVLAPNYFTAAPDLEFGDIILLHAADGLQFLPVRQAGAVGTGLVLDTNAARQELTRGAAGSFDLVTTASLILRMLTLDLLPNFLVQGDVLSAGASVTGPIENLRFILFDASKQVVSPPVVSPVAGGRAVAQFDVPAVGSGYALRVEDAADATLFAVSPSFSVTARSALLNEAGATLLSEARQRLVF